LCEELGIAFVAYSPLGRGFLTGAIGSIDDLAPDDVRRQHPRFQGENFRKNLELVDAVRAMAREKGCTPAQLALAWVLAQGRHIVPIPGTRSVDRLAENVEAVEIELTRGDLDRLDRIAPKGITAGVRYPEHAMSMLNRWPRGDPALAR